MTGPHTTNRTTLSLRSAAISSGLLVVELIGVPVALLALIARFDDSWSDSQLILLILSFAVLAAALIFLAVTMVAGEFIVRLLVMLQGTPDLRTSTPEELRRDGFYKMARQVEANDAPPRSAWYWLGGSALGAVALIALACFLVLDGPFIGLAVVSFLMTIGICMATGLATFLILYRLLMDAKREADALQLGGTVN